MLASQGVLPRCSLLIHQMTTSFFLEGSLPWLPAWDPPGFLPSLTASSSVYLAPPSLPYREGAHRSWPGSSVSSRPSLPPEMICDWLPSEFSSPHRPPAQPSLPEPCLPTCKCWGTPGSALGFFSSMLTP